MPWARHRPEAATLLPSDCIEYEALGPAILPG
jgi:hypothetical protein